MTTKKEYYDFCKKEKERLLQGAKTAMELEVLKANVLYKVIDSIYDHYIDKKETPDFDAFRSKYPVKKGKAKAKTKYLSIVKSGISHDTIMQGLDNYIKHFSKRPKEEAKFIKHPATWLTNGCRTDEYEVRLTTFVKKKTRVMEEKKDIIITDEVRERLAKAREVVLSKSIKL